MKTKRGLAAAAAIAALAIVTTGAISDGSETDSQVRQMRASLLDVRDGRTSLSELAGGFPGIPEPMLQRADVAAPEGFGPVEELTPELATPSPTVTIEPEPLATLAEIPEIISTAAAAPNPSLPPTDAVAAVFVQGWTAGGGDAASVRLVLCVLGKESGGDPGAYNPAGPFYGLMQFLLSTWEAMGGGDWRDPYTQGVNTAKLWKAAAPSGQWPTAYRLCIAGG